MKQWYRLDNAAKVFPSAVSEKNSLVYRFSFVLKEMVNPLVLQKAVDETLPRFPMFTVRLKKGIFWNYLDPNTEQVLVKEDRKYPCSTIDPNENNGFLFRVLYFEHRISLEAFHSLSDGFGAIEFFKTIVYTYLKLLKKDISADGLIILPDTVSRLSEIEDSFLRYMPETKKESRQIEQAFQIKGTPFLIHGTDVTSGILSADKLNKQAKSKNATITVYITALLIYSIYHAQQIFTRSNKAIQIAVPVNLRNVFPSHTLRNFFGVTYIGLQMNNTISFEEVIKVVQEQLAKATTKDNLETIIYHNVALEQHAGAKIVPLIFKDYFMNFGFNTFGEMKKTLTLSNVGQVKIPASMLEHIDLFELILYPTKNSPISCSLVSLNDKLVITFARNIVEMEIIRYFFTYLSQNDNLEVEIYSNDWGRMLREQQLS